MLGTLAFAGLAGLLSTLSPCVLPLLPIVLGSASAEHRWGPAALAAGVALSFTAIGLFVATIGLSIGLGQDAFRMAAAILLVAVGAILMVPMLQQRVAMAASPIATWTEARFGGLPSGGLSGQFGVGFLLGAVWSPCVGPTLGAASVAAARGESLGSVAVTMAAFGIGAALPLLGLGALSRQAMLRWRNRLRDAAAILKPALGAFLIAAGALILTGWDKRVETALLDLSPDWLAALATRF